MKNGKLNGKVAVVTGASKGIGAGIAKHLAAETRQQLKSIGHISRVQRILDNDAEYVEPSDMLAELAEDNKTLAVRLREAHNVCDEHRDMATASLIEVWIDETERRTWFLSEMKRRSQR